jgi:type I restriction enzyme S subunit
MATVRDKIKIEKYPAYKDSGAEWLGDIPEEWKAVKVKNVFRLVIEPAPKNNDFELLSVYTDIGVKPRRELEERGNKASTTDGYWFVKKGDIVVNKLLAWMGAIGVSNYDGVTSPAYDILRAKVKIDSNFFHYLFRNAGCISELKRHSRGIMDMRLRLYFDKFGDIIIPFPNFLEQRKIVEFLDHKTALIDQAISIKEKQIELLKERRQILIQKAVTCGLNPEVKMKESGVEWIGEIPEHWEVQKVTHIFRKIGSGTTPSSGEIRYYDGEINWLQTGDLTDGLITETSKKITPKAISHFPTLRIYPKGSLVIAMYGATIGKLGLLEINTTTNQACCVLANPKSMEIHYAYFLFLGAKQNIISMGYGGGQPNISQDLIKSLRITVPPQNEQREIIDFIEKSTPKIAIAISQKEKEIEKLKEYNATLINSAVTGKIKC